MNSVSSRPKPLRLLPRKTAWTIRLCSWMSLVGSLYSAVYCISTAANMPPECKGAVRPIELVLAAIWCIVGTYLTRALINGLLLRWLVYYSPLGTALRLLSFAAATGAVYQQSLQRTDTAHLLPVFIFLSCVLTVGYAIQNFITSDLSRPGRRSWNLVRVAVFAVVPIGLASFITMLSLLRLVFLLRPSC
ncbi:hypothetical protein CANCADRAFT_96975 [Tortispora caseinolytica NRRL Y-17796]|uniref:Uncharacterized protein n=1 Tax=Tortispora caseinolytica NRRL Y-17796 TaxID=767744 RepID=A0A1E4TDN0_9ASCO|nr:hypothetical protein CANCADRAFT_96975 [Tortispora caseinolytica NRRL Y-17796]